MTTSQTSQIPTKELERMLAERRAQDSLKELETNGIKEFKNAVATENSLQNIGRIARAFGARVYSVEKVLHPVEKKEKPKK